MYGGVDLSIMILQALLSANAVEVANLNKLIRTRTFLFFPRARGCTSRYTLTPQDKKSISGAYYKISRSVVILNCVADLKS